ncbi:hypothetical protein AHiyo4_12880 [Arthrobacter sp. Hiyo4]|nr:hypothetical protein AHiyo4_12880 [Arthrobacter sp. Hiyo4]
MKACIRHNLTLVEVPGTVPFAAIGLEFSQLLESDNAKVFRQLADINRQLMRAVLSARPEHELLAALAQRVPVWAVLVGADGRVRARAGIGVEFPALQPILGRLLGGSGPGWKWIHSTFPDLSWCSGIHCAAHGTPTSAL